MPLLRSVSSLRGKETRTRRTDGGGEYLDVPLATGDSLVFVGAALVRVNRGAARVLNFELKPRPDRAFYALYSPFWASALEITPVGFVAGAEITIRPFPGCEAYEGAAGGGGDGSRVPSFGGGGGGVKVVGGVESLLPRRLLARLLQVPGSRRGRGQRQTKHHYDHQHQQQQQQQQRQHQGHRSSSNQTLAQVDPSSGKVSLSGSAFSGCRFLRLPFFCAPIALESATDSEELGKEARGKEAGGGELSTVGLQKVVVPSHWSRALEACSTSRCLAVCGGKGVGKSTFARLVINGILSRQEGSTVLYLDTDLGQGEVGTPGIVSLAHLTVPLLGPPFTHMSPHQARERGVPAPGTGNAVVYSVYLGDASPRNDPEGYVAAVAHVLARAKEMITASSAGKSSEKPVLVVNTCGWVTGMGLEMLLQILRDAGPSDVVEIRGKGKARGIDLATAFAQSSGGEGQGSIGGARGGGGAARRSATTTTTTTNAPTKSLPFALHSVDAWASSMPKALAVPADLRALRLETYFEQYVLGSNALHASLSLAARVARTRPFAVPFSSIALRVLNSSASSSMSAADVLMAMNGSIVGLCFDENLVLDDGRGKGDHDEGAKAGTAAERGASQAVVQSLPAVLPFTPLCCCVGIGVVRSVNADRGELYILAPTAPGSALPKINLLMYGSMEAGAGLPLPASFWYDEGSHKPAPYASWSKDTVSKRGGVGTELRGRGVLKRRRLEGGGRR